MSPDKSPGDERTVPFFITFEGIDGTGKSTVARKVHEILVNEGVKVELTKEPTDSWLGQVVKDGYDMDISPFSEALLFSADRATHVREIRGLLADGVSVISDRYVDSTIAYQTVCLADLFDGAGSDPRKWLEGLWDPFKLVPDATFLFEASPALCLSRLGGRDRKTKFEKEQFLKKVQEIYLALAKEDERFIIIDASSPLEQVIDEVMVEIRNRLL